MKILLAIPPYTHTKGEHQFIVFPLGIAYIASVLEKAGHEVSVIDSLVEDPLPKKDEDGNLLVGLTWKKLMDKIKSINPDILGVSCGFTSQFKNTEKLCKLVREFNPKIKIFGGGAHASALTDKIIETGLIDYAIFGEGEETVVELVNAIEKNLPLEKIKGIGFLKNSKAVKNEKRPFIQHLDTLPFPARHLFPMEKYFRYGKNKAHNFITKHSRYTTIVASRGCPYTCSFCSIHTVWERSWRPRSPENILDEIELLVRNYNVKEIQFEDDNLTLIKERAMKLFQGILDRKLNINWTTPNGILVNSLDEDLIKVMKRSGCYRVNLGIESGNQQIVDKIVKKPLSLNHCRKIIKVFNKYKIPVTGFFVIGMPGETIRNIKETIEFIKQNDFDDILVSIASPYPGTELWDIAMEKGYMDHDPNSASFEIKPKYSTISTEDFTAKQVEELRNRAYIAFQKSKLKRHPVKFLISKRNYITLARYLKFFLHDKIIDPITKRERFEQKMEKEAVDIN
jgi:anaerobic magnesium-protoporphyrin IX monomethyl ester cyclase